MLKKKAFLWFGVVLFISNIIADILLIFVGGYTLLETLLVVLEILTYGFLTWNMWTRIQYLKTEETLPKLISVGLWIAILLQILLGMLI